jgi:hypothetical protein
MAAVMTEERFILRKKPRQFGDVFFIFVELLQK